MIKIIDVDTLFDKYISDYVYTNIGKVKPEEIENQIATLYVNFGNTKLKDLDGKTPNEYYKLFTGKELIQCLKEHLEKRVPVSDFLCEAITANLDNENLLLEAIANDAPEEFTVYVMNILADMNSKKFSKRYLEFVLWDYSETIRELATEALSTVADTVKEEILIQFNEVNDIKKSCLIEILSNASHDDRVFNLLINEFLRNITKVQLYANYLAKYGDQRALPYLLTAIENEKISYADFEELRFAIEALGGEYDKPRDFTADKTYKKIKGIKEQKSKN